MKLFCCAHYMKGFFMTRDKKGEFKLEMWQLLDKLTESMNYDFRYGRLNLKQMISKLRQNNLVSSFSRWLLRRMWSFFVIFDSNVLLLIIKKKKWRIVERVNDNLYNTKSWSVAFNVATLTLSHISNHVITFLFSKIFS